jgi:hypothetical protein
MAEHGKVCGAPAPDRSGRTCDRPAGHADYLGHWTYGGNELRWGHDYAAELERQREDRIGVFRPDSDHEQIRAVIGRALRNERECAGCGSALLPEFMDCTGDGNHARDRY